MSEIISKELLSQVLQCNCIKVSSEKTYPFVEGSVYFWVDGSFTYSSVNIYELSHKCKEWAKNQGYAISSGYSDMDYDGDSETSNYQIYSVVNLRCGYHSYNSKHDVDEWHEDMIFDMHNSEPEAIFKACQWILDNKDKQ